MDKQVAETADLLTALKALRDRWRSMAAHFRDIALAAVEDSDTHAYNMREARQLEKRADELDAALLRGEATQEPKE